VQDGNEVVLAYVFRSLSKAEKDYDVTWNKLLPGTTSRRRDFDVDDGRTRSPTSGAHSYFIVTDGAASAGRTVSINVSPADVIDNKHRYHCAPADADAAEADERRPGSAKWLICQTFKLALTACS